MTPESLNDLRPLADRILLRLIKREERSTGGIIIPQSAKDQSLASKGEIVAVGPGRVLDNGKLIEPRVKKGDIVLVGKYMGTEVEIEGDMYTVVREDDILGVIED